MNTKNDDSPWMEKVLEDLIMPLRCSYLLMVEVVNTAGVAGPGLSSCPK